MKARITEVFESIQGEGLYLGERQVFVRFFGCNLACSFCDTKLDRYTEYEPQELVEEIKLYHRKHHSVSFTGGEPLLQKDFLKEILKITHREGLCNYLETNGTLCAELGEVIEDLDIIAMDVKLPSSSGCGQLWHLHKEFLKIACAKEVFIKAIICQGTQSEDLCKVFAIMKEIHPAGVLVLQPNSYDPQEALAEKLIQFRGLCAENNIAACVIPQIHKIAGIK